MLLKIAAVSLSLVLFVAPALAAEQIVKLSVPGMECASCPYVVRAAIARVEGVRSVTADASERVAEVVFDDAVTNVEAIISATTNAGYVSSVIGSDS